MGSLQKALHFEFLEVRCSLIPPITVIPQPWSLHFTSLSRASPTQTSFPVSSRLAPRSYFGLALCVLAFPAGTDSIPLLSWDSVH